MALSPWINSCVFKHAASMRFDNATFRVQIARF